MEHVLMGLVIFMGVGILVTIALVVYLIEVDEKRFKKISDAAVVGSMQAQASAQGKALASEATDPPWSSLWESTQGDAFEGEVLRVAQGAWEALPQEEEGSRLEVKDLLSSFTKVAELPAGRERRRGMETLNRALVKVHHGALGLKHAGALAEVRLLEERFPGESPHFPKWK